MTLEENYPDFNKMHTGYDMKEHGRVINVDKTILRRLSNNVAFEAKNLKTAIIAKYLLNDRPPSYGACVV